jgi:hypothetical protein
MYFMYTVSNAVNCRGFSSARRTGRLDNHPHMATAMQLMIQLLLCRNADLDYDNVVWLSKATKEESVRKVP